MFEKKNALRTLIQEADWTTDDPAEKWRPDHGLFGSRWLLDPAQVCKEPDRQRKKGRGRQEELQNLDCIMTSGPGSDLV